MSIWKTKEIAQTFAPEIVGDNGDVVGPFWNAYKHSAKVVVIPLVIGAYGETNEDFQDLLKVCPRMAVVRGDAAYNSPVFETEAKDGAYFVVSPCTCWCPSSRIIYLFTRYQDST